MSRMTTGVPEHASQAELGEGFESALVAAKLGAEWAWAALYRTIAGPVTGFFRVRGVASPEDLAGDVFFELARAIDRFEGDEDAFRTLVFVIAYQRLIEDTQSSSLRRSRSRLAESVLTRLRSDPEAPDVVLQNPADVEEVFRALSPEQRDVLSLRIIGGLTVEQTARVVNKGVTVVRSLQRKGLSKVRNLQTIGESIS